MSDTSTDGDRTDPMIDERKFDVRRIHTNQGSPGGGTPRTDAVDGDDRLRGDPDRRAPARSVAAERRSVPRHSPSFSTARDDGEPVTAVPRDEGSTAAGSAPQLEELFFYQSVAGELTRPYLRSLPTGGLADRLVIGWLRYLTRRAGYRGTLDALDQYAAVGWIAEDVRVGLEEYLRAFHDATTATPGLAVRDHEVSLTYLARLVLLA
ncbi:MAG: FlaD/FlaE family flagellar protein [Halorientalis sp.]